MPEHESNGKVNLLSLPRPPFRTLEKVYTDPEAPGVELKLRLRGLVDAHGHADQFRIALVMDRVEAFLKKYEETGFPFPDGECIDVSRPVAEVLCYLEVRQDGPVKDRYTHEELLGLVRSMPNAYKEIVEDAMALDEPEKQPKGKRKAGEAVPNA